MPNPRIPHDPIETHVAIADHWRVAVRFVPRDGYTAQLEQFKAGSWRACGPRAASRRSAPCVLQRLADAYRAFGDAIEQHFACAPDTRITAGCTRCGYRHVYITQTHEGLTWHCPACAHRTSRR